MPQAPESGFRAWLERQALPQPDGSFLVRPFRRIPLIYQIDAVTKARLICFQMAFMHAAWIALASYLLVLRRLPPGPWLWAALLLALLAALGCGGQLILLRRAARLPASRWSGTAEIDPSAGYPAFVYLILAMLLTLLFAALCWRTLDQTYEELSWLDLTVLVVVGGLSAQLFRIYRSVRRNEA